VTKTSGGRCCEHGLDDLPCGMPHVRELLREGVGSEEAYSRLAEPGSYQDGCDLPVDVDLLHDSMRPILAHA